MTSFSFIGPLGIITSALILFAFLSGFPRFRLVRWHKTVSIAAFFPALFHSALSAINDISDYTCVFPITFLFLAMLSGLKRWRRNTHIILAVLFVLSALFHIGFVLYSKSLNK